MRKPRAPNAQNPIVDRLVAAGKQSKAYRASAKLERSLAKRAGGYRTAGSGNKNEKGDVRVRGVTRIEHKATQHASFRVTKEMLEKIELAGRACDEIPIFVVDFLDKRGLTNGDELAVIPLKDLMGLIDACEASKKTHS